MLAFIILIFVFLAWFVLGMLKVVGSVFFWIIFIGLAVWLISWGYKIAREKNITM